jgi:hypothetical protein
VSAGGGTVAERERLVRVCLRLSSTTALYSTRVPARRPLTSWNTRYGALSSVPIGFQAWRVRARNVTS